MRLINRSRGNLKTSMLVSTAFVTGMPIIASTNAHKDSILDTASKMNFQDCIDVYTIEEWKRIPHRLNDKVLIDDVQIILEKMLSEHLNAEVVAATMTVPMEDKTEFNHDVRSINGRMS